MSCKELEEILKLDRLSVFRKGQLLHGIKSQELYKYNDEFATWFDYLQEIGMSNSTANTLIKLYLTFNGIDMERLVDIPTERLKVLMKTKNPTEHLNEAEVLTKKDLKERLFEKENNDTPKRTYSYLILKRCNETGNLSKVHDVQTEEIIEAFNINEDGIRSE